MNDQRNANGDQNRIKPPIKLKTIVFSDGPGGKLNLVMMLLLFVYLISAIWQIVVPVNTFTNSKADSAFTQEYLTLFENGKAESLEYHQLHLYPILNVGYVIVNGEDYYFLDHQVVEDAWFLDGLKIKMTASALTMDIPVATEKAIHPSELGRHVYDVIESPLMERWAESLIQETWRRPMHVGRSSRSKHIKGKDLSSPFHFRRNNGSPRR